MVGLEIRALADLAARFLDPVRMGSVICKRMLWRSWIRFLDDWQWWALPACIELESPSFWIGCWVCRMALRLAPAWILAPRVFGSGANQYSWRRTTIASSLIRRAWAQHSEVPAVTCKFCRSASCCRPILSTTPLVLSMNRRLRLQRQDDYLGVVVSARRWQETQDES